MYARDGSPDPPWPSARYNGRSERDASIHDGALRSAAGLGRSLDVAYWQRLGPAAILEAAWQMAVDAHTLPPGGPVDLRLRKTVENFQRVRLDADLLE